jgi:hypothetical protein
LVSVGGALAMLAIVAALPVFLVWQARPSMWISFPVLSFASLMAIWLSGVVRKAFRSTNWLMRIAPDGLWINLRSYLNRDFAPAATVLFVPYAEIAGVGEHSVKREERNNGRITTWTDRYLEIHLVEPALAELAAEIAEERRRRAEGVHLGGLVTSSGRHQHVPVTVPRDDLVRIAWRGRQDFVVPRLKNVLRELTATCNVLEPTTEDAANVDVLTAEDLDRLILERVETGDTFGAIKLLRNQRGYSLKDAKQFIDELTVQL